MKVRTFEPVRNNRHWQGRLVSGPENATASGKIVIDLGAVKQNSKSRKAGVSQVEIELGNIERANLAPEI